MEYDDSKINETIYVVKNLEMPLLGHDAITKLNIIKRVFNVGSNKNLLTLEKLKDEYRKLFTGLTELQRTYSPQAWMWTVSYFNSKFLYLWKTRLKLK